MNALQFRINLPPAGQGRAKATTRGKFASVYKAKNDRVREAKLLELAKVHAPEVPFDEPLLLGVKAVLPIPQSKPKYWKAEALDGVRFPTTKPDLDNIVKLVKDALNGVFWTDDKIIVGYLGFPFMAKVYGEVPHYLITIAKVESYCEQHPSSITAEQPAIAYAANSNARN